MAHAPIEDDKPWYKQFWPWFLMSLPATAVVASLTTLKLAVDSPNSLVTDDYYKEGLAVNKDISKERLAKTLGLSAEISLDKDTRELRLKLAGRLTSPPPRLDLALAHPTLKGQDHQLSLLSAGNGLYVTRLPEIPTINWHVTLTPENKEWKLSGRMQLPEVVNARLE
jgi:uncharacterized protein